MIWYVIPARKGSKGYPYKNRVLFDYTAIQVKGENVIVSTDDDFLIDKAKEYNFKFINRSTKLSEDTTDIKSVMIDVVNKFVISKDDYIIMLYLPFPSRTVEDLYNFKNRLLKTKSMLCCKKPQTHPYLCIKNNGKQLIKHDLFRRQDYPEVFEICHYLSGFKVSELKNLNKNLYNDNTEYYMLYDRIFDIDTPSDFEEFLKCQE